MASYAAVISLKQTIQRFRSFCLDHRIFNNNAESSLEYASRELQSLQRVLFSLDHRSSGSERVSVVDGQIRDAAHKLEDLLEYIISDYFLPQSKSLGSEDHIEPFNINWEKPIQEINSFAEMKKDWIKELSSLSPEKDAAAAAADSSITTDFGGKKSEMVGLSVEYSKLKDLLIDENFSYKVVSLVGMAGIGKTTLAEKVYEEPEVSDYFECRVWVTIGQKHRLKEIVQRILHQVVPDSSEILKEEDKTLRSKLTPKRYLIVVDDAWDRELWDDLALLFPKVRNGSRVLVTTRLEKVSDYVSSTENCFESSYEIRKDHQIQMGLLDKEESWCLLRKKVFGEDLYPPQLLEKAGQKMAENCDGLPLTIVTVAEVLSKVEKTAEQWEKAAERKSSVFVEAYDQILEVLIPSYNYLPQYLKAYFLYLGVFPQNYEIPNSKLINLWSAEGFLETDPRRNDSSTEFLLNLVSDNLLMVCQYIYDGRIKTCRLHSAFWHMCIRVAGKNKFLLVLNRNDDGKTESIEGQRRLCIHNSILFGIKDVHKSMASISAAHSLLCTGQYHLYPVPLCFGLRLLSVLDALTIRFYEFPMEVINLVHLRYLTLTYGGKLPASISDLWNLQFLIIRQHLIIKSLANSSYLPVEIWRMKALKHLQIMGSDLPDPVGRASDIRSSLPVLKTLLDVSPRSCTERVFGEIRSLEKLGIQIELVPDAAELLSCFDNISELDSLKSLKCVFVNPIFMSEVVAPPPDLLTKLPSCLEKLSLSGFGYVWEEMSKIASKLPKLKVLKVRCFAFRGPKWNVHKEKFPKLEYLLIEDTDLGQWRCDDNHCFPSLKRLIIRHCYKLKQIPKISQYPNLEMIEVVDSTPSVVTRTKPMSEETKAIYGHLSPLDILDSEVCQDMLDLSTSQSMVLQDSSEEAGSSQRISSDPIPVIFLYRFFLHVCWSVCSFFVFLFCLFSFYFFDHVM